MGDREYELDDPAGQLPGNVAEHVMQPTGDIDQQLGGGVGWATDVRSVESGGLSVGSGGAKYASGRGVEVGRGCTARGGVWVLV